MNCLNTISLNKAEKSVSRKWVASTALLLVIAVSLGACSSKEKKGGQSLVKVDGEEITMLQLNEELQRANVQPVQQEAASKQLLESLIDRQLISAEAARNKIDRTPEVMQAIAHAKTQIITQAYLKSISSKATKPTKAEIDDYFQKHPELFSNRKQFEMISIAIVSSDLNAELKSAIDAAKSLDEVAAWLVKHDVKFLKGKGTRSSADLPAEMLTNLLNLPKGAMFIVNEGDKSMIVSVVNIKETPVAAKDTAPQIEQYLINSRTKEILQTEIAHLRSLAKIEYLNASAPAATQTKAAIQGLTTQETKPASTKAER